MKRVLSILAAVLFTANMFGQATQDLSYQAMITESDNELVNTNSLSNEANAFDNAHYVGEYYGGGIVYHVTEDGQHGLIHAIVDDYERKQKKNASYPDTIDFRDGIGAGTIITESVARSNNAGTYATEVLANSQADVISDWFLPTRYDLNLLYDNRAVIGGYAEFSKGWKLTGISSLNTWYQSFITGARFTNGKDDGVYVRVLRKF